MTASEEVRRDEGAKGPAGESGAPGPKSKQHSFSLMSLAAIILPLTVLAAAWALYPLLQPDPIAKKLAKHGLDTSPPKALTKHHLYGAPPDNWTCTSTIHPHPVLLLHGLGSNREIYLNQLAYELRSQGYCTFSLTYGAHPAVPWIGGLIDMRESAKQIAAYVREIIEKTGAKKVDIVGHSEGGVLALYVPMTQEGLAGVLERIVALGPAVHGADYWGFTGLLTGFGPAIESTVQAMIEVLGCEACVDMMDGPRGTIFHDFKSSGRITQEGNKVTIIVSTRDSLVVPEKSVIHEEGVRNVYIQDRCPDDRVGHNGLAWDKAVWGLVKNALEEEYDRPIECDMGIEI